MDEFTKLIEKLLNQQNYQPSGSEIFNSGNSILSLMNLQFNTGLEPLKNYFPEGLDQWINNQSFLQDSGL